MKHNQQGYVALASILVITAITVIISVSVSLLTVNELQSSLATKKGIEAHLLVEGCIEDLLLELNKEGTLSTTITLPEGSCSATIDSQVGNDSTFTVTGSFDGYTSTTQVTATRDTSVSVSNWQQQ